MKLLISLVALFVVAFLSTAATSPANESRVTDEHTQWIAKSLREIQGIKVGMTRDDLLKVFTEEGGISTRTWQRYVYRDCPYIKVEFEFEPTDRNSSRPSPGDKIIKISKPFLEWEILD